MTTVTKAQAKKVKAFRSAKRVYDSNDPTLSVDDLTIYVSANDKLRSNLTSAITAGKLTRTIEGASTVELTVHDPERVLLRSTMFDRAVDIDLGDLSYRLVGFDKQGDDIVLTFQDRIVSYLEAHNRPVKVTGGTLTRAEFIYMLIREVKKQKLKFYCPELHKIQPTSIATDTSSKRSTKQPGFAKGAVIKVKGTTANEHQKSVIEDILDVGTELKKPQKALIMGVMTITQESVAGIENVSSSGLHFGPFHQDASYGTEAQRRRPRYAAEKFFEKLDKYLNSGGTYGQIIDRVQVSGNPGGYDKWREEATATVKKYNNGKATSSSTRGSKRYEFSRGQGGKKENTWEAALRLAQEVNWRLFIVDDTVYFISEDDLFRAKAQNTISESHPAIDNIDGTTDDGFKYSELTVTGYASINFSSPGETMEVEGMGKRMNGKWLTKSIEQDLFSSAMTINLVKATDPLPEPLEQNTPSSKSSDGTVVDVASNSANQTQALKAFRRAQDISERNYPYVWGGGHNSTGQPSGGGYDCSGYVGACLIAAGLTYDGRASGGFGSLPGMQSGRGKYLTIYYNSGHVFMVFESALGVSANRADTGGGPPAGPHIRYNTRSYAGFQACHPTGL